MFQILTAIRDQIVTAGVCTYPATYISLFPEELMFPADDCVCILTPGHQTPNQGVITGAGNSFMMVDGDIHITLWGRLALDDGMRDDIYLTDPSLGLLKRYNCLVAALQITIPEVSGQKVLCEPMRLTSVDFGNRTVDRVGWAKCRTTWGVEYKQNVTCA